MTQPNIDAAISDPQLFGAAIGQLGTWTTWRACLKGAFGLSSRMMRPLYSPTLQASAAPLPSATDTLSAAQLSLMRRASAIECELEQMEGKLSQGEEVNLDVFTRSASHLRRILETLGIERKARDVTPDLQTYLKRKSIDRSAASSDGEERTSGVSEGSGGASNDGEVQQ